MSPCPSCGSHVRPGTACPACGSTLRPSRASVAAVLLGLALTGCGGDKSTDSTATTGDTADTTPTTGVDYGTSLVAPLEGGLEVPDDEPPVEVKGPR